MNKIWLAILGFLIGCVELELFNKFYCKGDKKKIIKVILFVSTIDLLLLLFLYYLMKIA